MINESLRNILQLLDNLNDDIILNVEDSYSGESLNGKCIDIYQWVIDTNNKNENKSKFKVVL